MSIVRLFKISALAVVGLLCFVSSASAAGLSGYVCDVTYARAGSPSTGAFYTSVSVTLYSQGGCGGNYLGSMNLISTDCANWSSCNAAVRPFYRMRPDELLANYRELRAASGDWRAVTLYSDDSGYRAVGHLIFKGSY